MDTGLCLINKALWCTKHNRNMLHDDRSTPLTSLTGAGHGIFRPRKVLAAQKVLENPGIDPGTSRMLSERSTIWANPPCCLEECQVETDSRFKSCGNYQSNFNKIVCRNPGLNQGPLDLQSNALPTELFRRMHFELWDRVKMLLYINGSYLE